MNPMQSPNTGVGKKLGELMINKCDLCGVTLSGNRKRFCSNKHKDRWHNVNNPRGKFAHLNTDSMSHDEYFHATSHPHDSDSIGQDHVCGDTDDKTY